VQTKKTTLSLTYTSRKFLYFYIYITNRDFIHVWFFR